MNLKYINIHKVFINLKPRTKHYNQFKSNQIIKMEFLATELSYEVTDLDATEQSVLGEAHLYKIILPPLNEITNKTHGGPHPESNKVFENFYAGAFPGEINDKLNDENLIKLLNEGFDTFVCMMSEYNPASLERQWRRDPRIVRPYMSDINRILENREAYPTLEPNVSNNITFKHYPIKDMRTILDAETLQAAREVADLLRAGKKVYLHCWGGHGRTGVIVCLVLCLECGITAEQAFEFCQRCHDVRENNCLLTPSPQTYMQREQVKRISKTL